MKWKATHILKAKGDAPRRVMLNSGEFFTRFEWEHSATPRWTAGIDGVAIGYDLGGGGKEHGTVSPLRARGEGPSSITSLRKEVTRIAVSTRIRDGGKMKRIIATMGPGDIISMRLEGQRKAKADGVDLTTVWSLIQRAKAAKLAADRKAKRQARRNA